MMRKYPGILDVCRNCLLSVLPELCCFSCTNMVHIPLYAGEVLISAFCCFHFPFPINPQKPQKHKNAHPFPFSQRICDSRNLYWLLKACFGKQEHRDHKSRRTLDPIFPHSVANIQLRSSIRGNAKFFLIRLSSQRYAKL